MDANSRTQWGTHVSYRSASYICALTHVRATNQSATTLYRIARNITPPTRRTAEMLLVTEIITRCIFIVTLGLTSVATARICLPREIHLSNAFRDVKISASHQKYSNLSPITRQLSSIIQRAPYGIARTYGNDLSKPDVILGDICGKDTTTVRNGRERMKREKRNWPKTRLVLHRQIDVLVILIFESVIF